MKKVLIVFGIWFVGGLVLLNTLDFEPKIKKESAGYWSFEPRYIDPANSFKFETGSDIQQLFKGFTYAK